MNRIRFDRRMARLLWRRKGPRHIRQWTARLAVTAGAILLGLAALAFAALSDLCQHLFASLIRQAPFAPLLASPAIFALVVFVTRRFVPEARGSGIPQVIAAARARESAIGKLVSPLTAAAKLLMTALMLLAGASVGREGPTVQISAAIMVWTHRVLKVPVSAGIFIAGGAAGVAAAFNTPLAGVAFAIEELAAAYEQKVAMMVMGAVMIAGLVSLGIAGDYVYFGAMARSLPLSAILLATPAIGIAGGVAGGLFSRLVLGFTFSTRAWPQAMRRHPVAFAASCGLLVAVIGLATNGISWGTGYDVTRQMVEGHAQPWWFGAAKFVATLATTLAGAPGGIFAPSLSVGAGLGNLLAPLFGDNPMGSIAVLGMAAYLVGVVRAPLTGVIIVSETTGSRGLLLPLFAAALIADGASALVCRERLYHGLARAFAPRARGEHD